MKKILKHYKLLFMILLLTFTLSGCVSLQDLKENQAFWKNSSDQTILWNGKEYYYLTDSTYSNFSPEFDDTYIFITKQDVPVLLATMEGDYANASKDGCFLNALGIIYCVEDKFEDMNALIESSPSLDCLAYKYSEYDDVGEEKFCVLTDQEAEIFKEILVKSTLEQNGNHSEDEYYSWVAELYICSEDQMFRRYENADLCRNGDGEYFVDSYTDDGYSTYVIPKEYYSDIKNIFAGAIAAEDARYAEYEEEY